MRLLCGISLYSIALDQWESLFHFIHGIMSDIPHLFDLLLQIRHCSPPYIDDMIQAMDTTRVSTVSTSPEMQHQYSKLGALQIYGFRNWIVIPALLDHLKKSFCLGINFILSYLYQICPADGICHSTCRRRSKLYNYHCAPCTLNCKDWKLIDISLGARGPIFF